MRPVTRILLGVAVVALVIITGSLVPAEAGSCLAGTTCQIELTHSNVTQLSPIDVRVTWNNTGATTVFSVQWISGGPGTPKFIEEFGYNTTTAITNITGGGTFADWTVKHTGDPGCGSGCNIDSFGNFATDASRPDGGFGVSAPIVFTLASLITSVPDNGNGAEFVVHVGGYPSGCSGFVSDGTSSGQSSTPSCGTAVSEPGTVVPLALFGLGLVSAGALLRGRSFRREA